MNYELSVDINNIKEFSKTQISKKISFETDY